ncbi:MAG: hypothetical protein M3Z10_02755 [Gemmatimonadota bacterium]|nr:hypothetical protein [Gemmatimonadota bacterium]
MTTGGEGPDAAGEHAQFEPEEQKLIRERVAAGEKPTCPRDGTPMTTRSIGGGSFGLGYARRREWLICPTCRRRVIFDLNRGTRN